MEELCPGGGGLRLLASPLSRGSSVTCLNITKKGEEEESLGDSTGSWTLGVQCHQRWPQVHRTSSQGQPVVPKHGSAPPLSHSALLRTIRDAPAVFNEPRGCGSWRGSGLGRGGWAPPGGREEGEGI